MVQGAASHLNAQLRNAPIIRHSPPHPSPQLLPHVSPRLPHTICHSGAHLGTTRRARLASGGEAPFQAEGSVLLKECPRAFEDWTLPVKSLQPRASLSAKPVGPWKGCGFIYAWRATAICHAAWPVAMISSSN